MNIVLVEPEIPSNTGNIARTCAVTGSNLHLVEPLGFSVEDKYLKRAGLDYWNSLSITHYFDFEHFQKSHPNGRFFYITKKGHNRYDHIKFEKDDFLIFGKETEGLPEKLLEANPEKCLRIPMKEGLRSLNLSNAVALVIYEALRQQGFSDLV